MFNLDDALNRWILNKDIVLFHGTSIECLVQILTQGALAAPSHFSVVRSRVISFFDDNEQRWFDEAYYLPSAVTLTGAYTNSRHYSWSKAFVDYLQYKCGMGDVVDDYLRDISCAHEELIKEDGLLIRGVKKGLIDTALRHDISETRVRAYTQEAEMRKGAVLGIHRNFFTGKRLRDFSCDFHEMVYPYEALCRKEPSTKGLLVDYIHAIYIPQDVERRELLTALKT